MLCCVQKESMIDSNLPSIIDTYKTYPHILTLARLTSLDLWRNSSAIRELLNLVGTYQLYQDVDFIWTVNKGSLFIGFLENHPELFTELRLRWG